MVAFVRPPLITYVSFSVSASRKGLENESVVFVCFMIGLYPSHNMWFVKEQGVLVLLL